MLVWTMQFFIALPFSSTIRVVLYMHRHLRLFLLHTTPPCKSCSFVFRMCCFLYSMYCCSWYTEIHWVHCIVCCDIIFCQHFLSCRNCYVHFQKPLHLKTDKHTRGGISFIQCTAKCIYGWFFPHLYSANVSMFEAYSLLLSGMVLMSSSLL